MTVLQGESSGLFQESSRVSALSTVVADAGAAIMNAAVHGWASDQVPGFAEQRDMVVASMEDLAYLLRTKAELIEATEARSVDEVRALNREFDVAFDRVAGNTRDLNRSLSDDVADAEPGSDADAGKEAKDAENAAGTVPKPPASGAGSGGGGSRGGGSSNPGSGGSSNRGRGGGSAGSQNGDRGSEPPPVVYEAAVEDEQDTWHLKATVPPGSIVNDSFVRRPGLPEGCDFPVGENPDGPNGGGGVDDIFVRKPELPEGCDFLTDDVYRIQPVERPDHVFRIRPVDPPDDVRIGIPEGPDFIRDPLRRPITGPGYPSDPGCVFPVEPGPITGPGYPSDPGCVFPVEPPVVTQPGYPSDPGCVFPVEPPVEPPVVEPPVEPPVVEPPVVEPPVDCPESPVACPGDGSAVPEPPADPGCGTGTPCGESVPATDPECGPPEHRVYADTPDEPYGSNAVDTPSASSDWEARSYGGGGSASGGGGWSGGGQSSGGAGGMAYSSAGAGEVPLESVYQDAPRAEQSIEVQVDESASAAAQEAAATGKPVRFQSAWADPWGLDESTSMSSGGQGPVHSVSGVATPDGNGNVRVDYQVNLADRNDGIIYRGAETVSTDGGGTDYAPPSGRPLAERVVRASSDVRSLEFLALGAAPLAMMKKRQ